MNNIMDYIFYRIYLFYKKKDDSPVLSGILFLAMLKLSIIFLLVTVLNLITDGVLSKNNTNLSKNMVYAIILTPSCIMFILDIIRYKRSKVSDLVRIYQYKKLNKTIKLWQIFILPILIIVFSLFLISIFGNMTSPAFK